MATTMGRAIASVGELRQAIEQISGPGPGAIKILDGDEILADVARVGLDGKDVIARLPARHVIRIIERAMPLLSGTVLRDLSRYYLIVGQGNEICPGPPLEDCTTGVWQLGRLIDEGPADGGILIWDPIRRVAVSTTGELGGYENGDLILTLPQQVRKSVLDMIRGQIITELGGEGQLQEWLGLGPIA